LSARPETNGGDVGARLAALLDACVKADASDLHLAAGSPPYLRVHGILDPVGSSPIGLAEVTALAENLVRGDLAAALAEKGARDGAVSAPDGTRFRFNVFRRQGELSIALRRLEDRFRTLGELGLPDALYGLCDLRDGLVVVSGPTGAGKSTTLATLIDRINRTRRCHIVTIEDPIEYLHRPAKSLVNQRQIGQDAPEFNDALVSAMRQDPDVILVGEIRDLATIRTAITAAETGHLVFTTLHAGDCVGSIERLVGVFPADEQDGIRRQLSLVLRAIVAQRLLPPRENGDGAAPARPGRVVASEVLMATPAVANLVASAKSAQIYSAMESGQALGMQTMEQDLARLAVSGVIADATAYAVARNAGVLADRMASLRRREAGLANGGAR